jgi:two-component system sensor histidine kinase BaeS
MKFKLSYKFFIAFILTSIMVVALMVGLIQFYVARNFAEYATQSLLERYGDFADALAAEYQTHKGWQALRDNPDRWEELLQSNLPRRDSDNLRRSSRPEAVDSQKPGGTDQDAGPSKSSRRVQRLARILALFDKDKRLVAGGRAAASSDGYSLRKITVADRTVGWLGLPRREHLVNPLAVGFLKQQTQMLYIIGGGILLLAALVAFLLSRQLLAPIRKLTAGTQALMSRRFDARIDIAAKDELGQLAADFNAMAQTLEKYERLRQQWISDIAHELRTPLSILCGEVEALQDGVREVNSDTLDSLHSEATHLSKIVNDLHELSLADSGELAIRKQPVDPLRVFNKTFGYFRQRFTENQITVQNDLENHQAPHTIMGDESRLQQLFSNLLENNLRYAGAPGQLKIGYESIDNRLILFFEDSGPGVPEEALEHLFDRLFRVDRSRSRTQGGSGLGLSICKSIVKALGGKIRAANASAGGLRIEIELPLA